MKLKKNSMKIDECRREMQSLSISKDWFSDNIPFWLFIFDTHDYNSRKIKALEIVSWEGLSSYFILKNIPKCHLTCVDKWQGSKEHKYGNLFKKTLKNIEKNFDNNNEILNDRIIKFKVTSFSFFTLPKLTNYMTLYISTNRIIAMMLSKVLRYLSLEG